MKSKDLIDRRDFVRAAGATAAISMVAPGVAKAEHFGEDTITVGLIGCGGRGTGAAWNSLQAGDNVQLNIPGLGRVGFKVEA